MSLQVVCDDCSATDDASERIDEVIKPAKWGEVWRHVGRRAYQVDLCPECLAIEEQRKEAEDALS